MKKFGTPILAAPGSASVYDGSLRAGVALVSAPASSPASASASAAGSFGGLLDLARQRLGVRRRRRSPGWRSSVGSSTFVLVLSTLSVPSASSCRRRPCWFSGVAVAVGVARRRGGDRGRLRRRRRGRGLRRAEVDDRGDGRGQARDLDLVDRRAGRDLDRDRELLAGDERHAHVVHLGVGGGHEHARVERGCGERNGEWTAGRIHEPDAPANLADRNLGCSTRRQRRIITSLCAVSSQLTAIGSSLNLWSR